MAGRILPRTPVGNQGDEIRALLGIAALRDFDPAYDRCSGSGASPRLSRCMEASYFMCW